MLAITWSVPRPTKHITGNQIETILEIISREEMARKTAMQTSQLPIARKKVSDLQHKERLRKLGGRAHTENAFEEYLVPLRSDAFCLRKG